MTKNLFVAVTPAHVLNATEARDRFHQGEENVLIVLRSPLRRRQASRQQSYLSMLAEMVDDEWSTVWMPPTSKRHHLFFPALAAGFIRQHSRVGTIYTASFQSNQMHLINSVQHDRIVLIDDGNGIHELIDAYQWKQRQVKLRHRLLCKNTRWPSGTLHVFSCFDVDENCCQLTRNDYRCLRKKIPADLPVRDDEIVFASQPLNATFPHVKIKTESLLTHLKQSFSVDRCRYLAHPREATAVTGWESLTYSIELFPLREGYLPAAFVTYYSSCARTLRILYDVPVICLKPPEDFWPTAAWAQLMDRCYAECQAVGASIQRLDAEFYQKIPHVEPRAPWSHPR